MSSTPPAAIKCENCGAGMGRLEDAFVWLNLPVCAACYQRLRQGKGLRYRTFWMPVAIAAIAICIALACVTAAALLKLKPDAPRARTVVDAASDNAVPHSADAVPHVVSAMWGSGKSVVDVSSIVQAQLTTGKTVAANNGPLEMKTDPAFGKVKAMTMKLALGDRTLALYLPENSTLSLERSPKATSFDRSAATKFEGHSYQVFDELVSWHIAEKKCEEMGGYLTCVTSEKEDAFIKALSKSQDVWLGGTDEEKEGEWRWVTGEPFTYSHWVPSAPDNYMGDQNHTNYWNGRGWDDSCAGHRLKFICEWDD